MSEGTHHEGAGMMATLQKILLPPMKFDPSCKYDQSLVDNAKPHHREAVKLALTDLYGVRHEALIRLPSSWERALCNRVLNDPRDLRLFLTFLQITLWLVFSCYVQLFVLPKDDPRSLWWMAIHLPVTWIAFGQRFILAMHYAAHRPLFSPKHLGKFLAAALNVFPQVIISNFYGMPAGTYYVHHCVMHHQANNFFPYDISSTMPYNRASPLHFLAYVINFTLHTMLYLPFYALKKRRLDVGLGVALCVGVYLSFFYVTYNLHANFFLTSFAVSFILGPFALMLGNYSQHIFVNPDDPTSNYGLACNHINAPFNMLTFNDGYHITHHVSSITHWSEMPLHFIQHLDQYEAGGALLFQGIAFDDITLNVFQGEKGLKYLASKVIQIVPDEKKLSESEIIALFKKRLQPIESEATKLKMPQLTIFMANEVLWVALYFGGFPAAIIPAMAIPLFHALYWLA